MNRFTFKKWFEYFRPGEETTTICVDEYTQIVEPVDINRDCAIGKQHYFLVGAAVEKLAEYEDADEAGLLFRLPCKTGDILYQLDKRSGSITPRKVLKIDLEIHDTKGYTMQIWFANAGFCFESHFGKTVFRNKADAFHAFEEYQSRNET